MKQPPQGTWTVQDAKARLSELLRRARAGTPQRIGTASAPCILISEAEWQASRRPRQHLGRWLVANTPRGGDLEQPSRAEKRAADPFRRGR